MNCTRQHCCSRFAAMLFILLLLTLAACGTATPAPAAPAPIDLSIQLSWVHEYSSAPFYAAELGGHFAAEGLQVRLEEGGFSEAGYIDPISEVLAGKVDFGLSNASGLIAARAAGKPVVALAAVLQRSPTAVISLATNDIVRPQDLVGRSVAVTDGGAAQTLRSLLQLQGIDPNQVSSVPRTSFGVEPLLSGEVDAMVAWVINEGVQLREAGQEPRFMLASDYGVDTYDFVLFTAEQTVVERPDVVQRVVRGLTLGLRDVIADPERAADQVLSYAPDLDRSSQLERLHATIPLIRPAGSQPGTMQADIWALTQDMLIEHDALSAPIDLDQVYTLTFIENSYEGE
jgi:ABC-type nitrate/sulfonate/bicarbonate transport system substrate-binding protein